MQVLLLFVLSLGALQQGGRAPVPDPSLQKEKEKVIRDLFKSEYQKKSPGDRITLARLLGKQSLETRDDPVSQYVLLREARDLAVQAGDLSAALEFADLLGAAFDIDLLRTKSTVVIQIAQDTKSADVARQAAEFLLRSTDEPSLWDDPEAQEKMIQAAAASARRAKDLSLAARCDLRGREIADLKARIGRLRAARETLLASPDDAAANLEVGQFECFIRGNWTGGLPNLAKGSSELLRNLALRDLSAPDQAQDQVALADAWRERSEKEPGGRIRLRQRAAFWYEEATKGAAGILKIRAEKALSELSGSGPTGGRAKDVSPQGLVGWWKLDDPGGTSAEDSSGQKNAGKLAGKAEFVPGHLGRAIKLSGASDRIVIPDSASLRVTGDLTLSLWFRKDESPTEWARLVGKGEYYSRNYGLWVGAGFQRNAILFQQWDNQKQAMVEISSTAETSLARWTHVAAVAKGEQASLYIDGKLDKSAKRTTATPATTAAPLTIGFAGWSEPFYGALDDVRIYSRALTDSEVELLASMK